MVDFGFIIPEIKNVILVNDAIAVEKQFVSWIKPDVLLNVIVVEGFKMPKLDIARFETVI